MAVSHGATGKVATGFSYPWVGVYTASTAGVISYSSQQELARGVSVSIDVDEPQDNDFWANNTMAESAPGRFGSGTLNLVVDGLHISAQRLIQGLPAAVSGWTSVGDSAAVPYCGLGYIVRYMSGNVESFTPTILPKIKFNPFVASAATEDQGEIDWQTLTLTAKVFRADNDNHDWNWIGDDYSTEADALAALKTKLGVSS